MGKQKLGIAIVGLGGAVGTTIAAGLSLLKSGEIGADGLPLAGVDCGLAEYQQIGVGGWDLAGQDLAAAALAHDVIPYRQFLLAEEDLERLVPWTAYGNREFHKNIDGENRLGTVTHRETIEQIRKDIAGFGANFESVVIVNLASTESLTSVTGPEFETIESFENAIDSNSNAISPSMLYAYAAISEGVPYANFTPSVGVEIPALVAFAKSRNVPVAGKDGKTGQTFIKTVLAPALKSRALKVSGWYSTNLLGNRDGLALSEENSLASKIKTKESVLRGILGYEVEDHIVDIRYYKPRGDNKEAWDNVDFTGFLGQPMQLKVNFLCKDSVLAAPLAIEIARCLDLAKRRGAAGIQEQLSVFFKDPMCDGVPVHEFHKQESMLLDWLDGENG
ncbi:MAG: inositol-3-phosphate synthase [Pyrinomonadaceae bacterium]